MNVQPCPLCKAANETVLWHNDTLRVIDANDPLFPGFTRVIWQDHVKEMTELPPAERAVLMAVVWQVEQTLRNVLQPDKINLAQFGNMVPHLHWHVIPRWTSDSHFPDAIWAPTPGRSAEAQQQWNIRKAQIDTLLPRYHATLISTLSAP